MVGETDASKASSFKGKKGENQEEEVDKKVEDQAAVCLLACLEFSCPDLSCLDSLLLIMYCFYSVRRSRESVEESKQVVGLEAAVCLFDRLDFSRLALSF